ncbi:hypothetical protein BHM03_00062371 [Ensete ventricosum]|nr:hypothetical protein BHM03_00062371 [Ensete ventricosum]
MERSLERESWSTLRTEGEGVIVGGQEVLVGHDDSHGADDVHGPRTRVRHRRQTLPVLHSSRLLDRTGVVDLPKARGRVGSGGSRRGEGRRVAQGERMRRGVGRERRRTIKRMTVFGKPSR